MEKILMLACANIKKSRSQAVSFFIIIVIAALLLNLGLITLLNYGSNFDRKYDKLNSAHMWYVINSSGYKEEYFNYIKNHTGVTEAEKRSVMYFNGTFPYGNSNLQHGIVIFDAGYDNKISKFSFVEKLKTLPDDAIFLPYIMKTGGKVALGSKFTITIGGVKHKFTAVGFYEEMNTGTINMGIIGFALPHDKYETFSRQAKGAYDGVMMLARLNDKAQSKHISSDVYNYIASHNDYGYPVSIDGGEYQLLKMARTITANIGSSIIIVFSLIITLVSLIVIKFHISNSIEEDMCNIGALKAIGYTSGQIIWGIIMQFAGMALSGALLGCIGSIFVLPALRAAFSAQTGIVWEQGFDIVSALLMLCVIFGATVIVSLFSAWKIRRLPPITALRGGINTHNFKKNYMRLDKWFGNLDLLISMKSMIQNIRQNVMIAVIIAAVCFASLFALAFYYNIAVDDKAFVDTISGEYPTVSILLNSQNYNNTLINKIKDEPEVRKAIYYDTELALLSNNEALRIYVTNDYSVIENRKCYEGRDPVYDNEIAVNGNMEKELNKCIGDTLTVKYGNRSYEYLITGFIQTANGADDSEMTAAGYRLVNTNFKPMAVYIYLKNGTDANAYLKKLQDEYGNFIKSVQNSDELKTSMLSVYIKIVTMIAGVIIVITAAVIALILYLVVKTVIINRRQELGIKKAVGFTTPQLILQIGLSFLPAVIAGAVIGGTAGYYGISPMISVMLRSVGIMKMNLIIPPSMLILLCTGICVFAFIVSTFVSIRIRKISAYALISE